MASLAGIYSGSAMGPITRRFNHLSKAIRCWRYNHSQSWVVLDPHKRHLSTAKYYLTVYCVSHRKAGRISNFPSYIRDPKRPKVILNITYYTLLLFTPKLKFNRWSINLLHHIESYSNTSKFYSITAPYIFSSLTQQQLTLRY